MNDITVISSAILDKRRKIAKEKNHIRGADGDFNTCLKYLYIGTRAISNSKSEMPESRLAFLLAAQMGK